MKDLPDVAAELFTREYRAVKLKGKEPKKNAPGTGSCFDTTDPKEVTRAFLESTKKNLNTGTFEASSLRPKSNDPVWDSATLTYRTRSILQGPNEFLKKGAATTRTTAKKMIPVAGPPIAGAFKPRVNLPDTAFRRAYERGDLPVAVEHHGLKNVIAWKAEVAKLDYQHFLPLFFDGIRETQEPYRFLAVKGVEDLLQVGGKQILPVIPLIIAPLKRALNTRDEQVMIIALQLMQKLVVSAELVGQALVPYYRQLLPVCNMYANRNKNLGDKIDYAQHEGMCLGEVVAETLALLQAYGGPDAFINIKYLVPTYESSFN